MDNEKIKELIIKSISEMKKEEEESLKSGIFLDVDEAISAAKKAFNRYLKITLKERNEIIKVIKERILLEADGLAEMTVKETGMGNIENKIEKFIWAVTKTPGIEDLITVARTDDDGMTLYELSPYGVVCSVAPVTNPCATLINNIFSALAAGNSVIHCPHPRAKKVSEILVDKISSIIRDVCGIDNLVVMVKNPSIKKVRQAMRHPDVSLVVATGGKELLKEALACGKKVIGGGSANPVCIVDETAKIENAALDIIESSSFDNNLMCVTEKNIIVVEGVAKKLKEELIKNGAYYITSYEDVIKLTKLCINQNLQPNKILNGMDANKILELAGINCERKVRIILVDCVKQNPMVVNEMMMPVLPVIEVKNFDGALETAMEVEQNLRHTAVIHSQIIERLSKAAKEMQTSIFVKNGPAFSGIGFRNDRELSMTVASITGEGTITARNFARTRRCVLCKGFSIR